MKRLAIILGSLMLVAALAYPVFAWGPRWGRGHHMMGYWGGGHGCSEESGREYGNLTQDQRKDLDALNRSFYENTRNLRDDIWTKSRELNTVLNNPNPDAGKAKKLQKEISKLRDKLADKRLAYRLEVQKIAPDAEPGRGYGPGMMGYGPDHEGRGRGPGYCWD